jgi:protein SCO1/2
VSKKALLALCVVVLIPLAFYLVASRYGVTMPRRFFMDSVITTMKDGKQMTDTVWHRVENIPLVNQLGESVSLEQDSGKVIVVDFFFTHCASICPILMRNIKRMQDGLKQRNDAERIDTSFVRFMSISVDPVRDSAPVLKRYADRYGVNSDVWWLLTGQKKTIYDFALQELKLGLQDSVSVDSNFVHTDYVTLLDKEHVVRGYYHGTDTTAMNKLADDIVFIMLEKDKHRKSVFTELRPLMIPILIILIGTFIGVIYFSRRSANKKYPS